MLSQTAWDREKTKHKCKLYSIIATVWVSLCPTQSVSYVCLVFSLSHNRQIIFLFCPLAHDACLQLPFEESPVEIEDMLSELKQNQDVAALRDQTGADLVQMVGYFTGDFCGLG